MKAFIKYTKEGKVAVNSQKVEEEKEEGGKVAELEEYDQLLVPAGKRAKIELSDGLGHCEFSVESDLSTSF